MYFQERSRIGAAGLVWYPRFMKHRVAACQILTGPDVGENSRNIIRWIGRAAEAGADAVAFPESTLFGAVGDRLYWDQADPKEFEEAESEIASEAKKRDIAVICGTAHWEGDRIYNDLIVIDKGGAVRGRYSKTHLVVDFDEPGKILPVYTVAGVKSCFIICHDIRYPELVRLPAAAGAQICYFASNEDGLLLENKLSAYRAMPIARATENWIFVVMANSPADPSDIAGSTQSHGNSKIIHPDGNVMVEAGFFEETIVSAEIDLDEADRRMVIRSIEDDTILTSWMREGLKLVSSE